MRSVLFLVGTVCLNIHEGGEAAGMRSFPGW